MKATEERKGYANTEELQADDQLFPRPSSVENGGEAGRSGDDATQDGAQEEKRIPPPATSE